MKKLLALSMILATALCYSGRTKDLGLIVNQALCDPTNGAAQIRQLLINGEIQPRDTTRIQIYGHGHNLLQDAAQRHNYPVITVLVDAGADSDCISGNALLAFLKSNNLNSFLVTKAKTLGLRRYIARGQQMKNERNALTQKLPNYSIPKDLIVIIVSYVSMPEILPPPTTEEIDRVTIEEIG